MTYANHLAESARSSLHSSVPKGSPPHAVVAKRRPTNAAFSALIRGARVLRAWPPARCESLFDITCTHSIQRDTLNPISDFSIFIAHNCR